MQPTNWKMIILQKFSNKSESSEPQGRLFRLKSWHQEEKSTPLARAFSFEGQRGLMAGAPQDRGKQTLNHFCMHTRFCVHWDRAVTPEETGLDLPEGLGESPWQVGSVVAHWVQGEWWQRTTDYWAEWVLPEVTILPPRPGPIKWPTGSSARMQHFKHSSGKEHSPIHEQTRFLKPY